MSYINEPFDLANAETKIVHLDRWSYPAYTLQLDAGTSVLLEGTTARINRGETPNWQTMDDQSGTAITAAGIGLTNPDDTPVEAVRITATGACTGRFMQTGSN